MGSTVVPLTASSSPSCDSWSDVQSYSLITQSHFCVAVGVFSFPLGLLYFLLSQDVSCNELQRLPAELGQLECLRDLNLRRNRLTTLPEGTNKLGPLSHSWLLGNPQEESAEQANQRGNVYNII